MSASDGPCPAAARGCICAKDKYGLCVLIHGDDDHLVSASAQALAYPSIQFTADIQACHFKWVLHHRWSPLDVYRIGSLHDLTTMDITKAVSDSVKQRILKARQAATLPCEAIMVTLLSECLTSGHRMQATSLSCVLKWTYVHMLRSITS
eukprot:TRINITY_DN9802_c0_g1_i5.p2 TRINITY_DN9802_c0_g1~~TRINITY_DN9802_c0_g1_i5.p2  ORF type:complete len:150 (+),score=16.83 TRINITY_DN9802_c0_g1_i5:579-1028(+)